MKWLGPFALLLTAISLIGCGDDHHLTSVSISPTAGTAMSSSHGQVAFSATGTLNNGSTRALSSSDGLVWSTSDTTIATIDDSGAATCQAPGTVTITGTAPQSLNRGSSSQPVSGTATLACT
jgi:Big-like domain-containing protein